MMFTFPVCLIIYEADDRFVTLRSEDEKIALPVFESFDEAGNFRRDKRLINVEASECFSASELLHAILSSMETSGVTHLLIPRGTAAGAGESAQEIAVEDAVSFLRSECDRNGKAGLN